MDDNTCKLNSEKNRERAERILGEQIDGLEQMLESVGVEFPAEHWEYLHNNVNISLASEAIPVLEELTMDPDLDMKDRADLAMIKVEYQRSRAFYTHHNYTPFLPMSIHLGLRSESASDYELRCLLSAEFSHAFSYSVVKDVRGLKLSLAVTEFYEIAFSWWTEKDDSDLRFMKASYLYKECMQRGKGLGKAAEDAVYFLHPEGTLNPSEYEETVQATLTKFEILNNAYPFDSSGTHDSHVIGGWMGWLLLEEISKHVGQAPEDCMLYLTQVAAKALVVGKRLYPFKAYLRETLARLQEYLSAKTS